jgi:preprotein translocase subunit YajC
MGYVIVLVALFGLMWLLLIRPQRRRSQVQMTMQDRLRSGDEIITAGGLHAIVRSIEDDVLEIELAPGTIVRLDRRAVAAVVTEPETDAEPEPEPPQPEQSVPPDDG